MGHHRIKKHPILEIPARKKVPFQWNGHKLSGYEHEPVASALIANGFHIFGHHPKDRSPQGIFCANGQCSQCLVTVDGLPVKACMTPLLQDMVIHSVEGRPQLPPVDDPVAAGGIPVIDTHVLIIGGGPAGISAALELARNRVAVTLIDDKDRLGGKLVLQTHKFFGSVEDSHAGVRGSDIARLLADQVQDNDSIQVWLNTNAVGVFADGIVGVVRHGAYRLIRPQRLLVAAGAREKTLAFPGGTLPGVYGAGAFQTLVNRDLVKSARRILVVGGGNVGLIAAYHAVQAGIQVVALVEALPQVSGYKVHADKLRRTGVPLYTGHTILEARGREHVQAATIAALDNQWQPKAGSEKTFQVDSVLIATGLDPVNEFTLKAQEWGVPVFAAGDALEIAEASAAMFSGRIAGFRIAASLGVATGELPSDWTAKEQELKSRPGDVVHPSTPLKQEGCVPVFHCRQEIPCNPCTSACPTHAIHTRGESLSGIPYRDDRIDCSGCMNCVAICPGLAVTLLDFRQDRDAPLVTLPYEIEKETVTKGRMVTVTGENGDVLGSFPVEKVRLKKKYPKTLLVQMHMTKDLAPKAAGIQVQPLAVEPDTHYDRSAASDDAIVCRCERVSAGDIRTLIRDGIYDMNQLKALTRAGMGSCGSKTCRNLIRKIFKDEGVDLARVVDRTDRPLFVEVSMGCLAGIRGDIENGEL